MIWKEGGGERNEKYRNRKVGETIASEEIDWKRVAKKGEERRIPRQQEDGKGTPSKNEDNREIEKRLLTIFTMCGVLSLC